MAVDLFEEIVRGAFQAARYLTTENVPYKLNPNAKGIRSGRWRADAVSDIDLIAMHPRRSGKAKVLAISCKGGGEPLVIERDLARLSAGNPNQSVAGSCAATGFRELTDPDWAIAFRQAVHAVTGAAEFTHVLAVKKACGERKMWNDHAAFHRLTPHLTILDLTDLLAMLRRSDARLFRNSTTARLADLVAAA